MSGTYYALTKGSEFHDSKEPIGLDNLSDKNRDIEPVQ